MWKELKGIFAPINTPFVNEEASVEFMRQNVRRYAKTALAGYLAIGSNGENKCLTDDEKLSILQVVLEEKAEKQIVMAGAGDESTRLTIAFAKRAVSLGVDYISVVTPSYFKKSLTDDALIGYYTDIAEALPVPVLIYNAPGFTGVTLSAKVIETLAKHPNIAGMKDTSTDGIGKYLLAAAGTPFQVLSGTINTLLIGLVLGAKGGVVSLANAYPEPCCELFEKFRKGDLEGARKIHFNLFRLNNFVSGKFGVAGVKYASEVAGYHGGSPRLPVLPLKDTDKKLIRDAIHAAGL